MSTFDESSTRRALNSLFDALQRSGAQTARFAEAFAAQDEPTRARIIESLAMPEWNARNIRHAVLGTTNGVKRLQTGGVRVELLKLAKHAGSQGAEPGQFIDQLEGLLVNEAKRGSDELAVALTYGIDYVLHTPGRADDAIFLVSWPDATALQRRLNPVVDEKGLVVNAPPAPTSELSKIVAAAKDLAQGIRPHQVLEAANTVLATRAAIDALEDREDLSRRAELEQVDGILHASEFDFPDDAVSNPSMVPLTSIDVIADLLKDPHFRDALTDELTGELLSGDGQELAKAVRYLANDQATMAIGGPLDKATRTAFPEADTMGFTGGLQL